MKPTDIPKDTECKFSSGASNYGLEREEKNLLGWPLRDLWS